jgi:uncharacterized protein YehS (DUF1456 family)
MMPEHKGPDMSEDRGMPQYDYISFMEKLINDERGREEQAPSNVLQDRTNRDESPRKESKMNGNKVNGFH